MWSFIRAGFTDPGSVQCNTATAADAFPPESDPDRAFKPKRRICPKCNCIKPPRAHHCSTCGRCIVKMDHHCPWVNNCVGTNNLKHFLLFLLWVGIGAAYAFTLSAWRFLSCWAEPRRCPVPSLQSVILVVSGAVLSVFFVIFVVAMACDQYEGVTTNTTAIESMKSWTEEHRSVMQGLTDVMGEPFSWRWFVPLPLPRDSPSFYVYKPTDDPDAYDRRDPVIQRHFRKIEEAYRQQQQRLQQLQQQQQADNVADFRAAPAPAALGRAQSSTMSAESTSAPDVMGDVFGLTMRHREHSHQADNLAAPAAGGEGGDGAARVLQADAATSGLRKTARGQARNKQ